MPVTAVRTVVLAGHVRPSGPKVCSIGGSVCVHPVLRSTHARLLLAFGITSYLVLCTAVYLPSDHPHLQGAAAAMPGRALCYGIRSLARRRRPRNGRAFTVPRGRAREVAVCDWV